MARRGRHRPRRGDDRDLDHVGDGGRSPRAPRRRRARERAEPADGAPRPRDRHSKQAGRDAVCSQAREDAWRRFARRRRRRSEPADQGGGRPGRDRGETIVRASLARAGNAGPANGTRGRGKPAAGERDREVDRAALDGIEADDPAFLCARRSRRYGAVGVPGEDERSGGEPSSHPHAFRHRRSRSGAGQYAGGQRRLARRSKSSPSAASMSASPSTPSLDCWLRCSRTSIGKA